MTLIGKARDARDGRNRSSAPSYAIVPLAGLFCIAKSLSLSEPACRSVAVILPKLNHVALPVSFLLRLSHFLSG